jgi:hypothetical protein
LAKKRGKMQAFKPLSSPHHPWQRAIREFRRISAFGIALLLKTEVRYLEASLVLALKADWISRDGPYLYSWREHLVGRCEWTATNSILTGLLLPDFFSGALFSLRVSFYLYP